MVRKEESISSVDTWEDSAVLICQEIRDWSEKILEVASAEHGGFPPCPFARQAWMRENVMVHVTPDLEAVIEMKALYPPTSDNMHIMAWTGASEMSPEEFYNWVDKQNVNHFGVWITGFHPDAEDDESIPEYNGIGADDYAIILMQSYEHLVSASNRLFRTGYYRAYTREDMNLIKDRKEKFDAWNEKINAKAYEHSEEEAVIKRLQGETKEH